MQKPLAVAIACSIAISSSCVVAPAAIDTAVLMEADRSFAADTAARGLAGWLDWFADDAVKLAVDGEATIGLDSIEAAVAPLFADRNNQLLWEPELAGWTEPGERGYTRGRWKFIRSGEHGDESTLARGTYLSFWRRVNGQWRVEFDFGVNDPPTTAKQAP